MAIASLERKEPISANALCLITKIYSQVFYKEVQYANSRQRKSKSMIESFSFAAIQDGTTAKSPKGKLKTALLEMMSDLSSMVGQRTTEE